MLIDLPKADTCLRSYYFDRETDYSLRALADALVGVSKSDLVRLGAVAVVMKARKSKPLDFESLKASVLNECA